MYLNIYNDYLFKSPNTLVDLSRSMKDDINQEWIKLKYENNLNVIANMLC